jgi:hypothetical protein
MTQTVRQSRDELADELEIRDLVHRYADASSRRDPPESQALSRLTASGVLRR